MAKIASIIGNFSNKSIALGLFIYCLFIRFPFFFRDYIDRDESTFILLGQSVAEGCLPYTQLWDLKPPLTFIFFGIIIFLFGKSFIAIRLFGVALVTISSYFTYKISSQFHTRKVALAVGLLCVILQSLFGSLQGVMSEHIAIAFFVPAIWLLVNPKQYWYSLFLASILMGIVVMVKLNMAYAALFVGFYLVGAKLVQKNWKAFLITGLIYSTGILFVIALTFFPYYVQNIEELWWKSVIEAPLNYASARRYHPLKMTLNILPFIGLIFCGIRFKILQLNRAPIALFVFALVGILISFIQSGRINGHYLILIHPILVLIVGFFIQYYTQLLGKLKAVFWIIILFLIPMESYLEYVAIARHKIEKGSFYNGEGISVPNYLKDHGLQNESILFFEYHIGYWVLNTKPPTKAALHPSNILRDELFFAHDNPRNTGIEELQYLMENVQPEIVVTRKNRRVFDKEQEEANTYINYYLNNNYEKLDSIDKALVHRRLKFQ